MSDVVREDLPVGCFPCTIDSARAVVKKGSPKVGVIVERGRLERSQKPPRLPGGRRQPNPEQIAQFEADYEQCLQENDLLLSVVGPENERREFMQTIKTWATDRKEGRVTVRLYEHRREDPWRTYYRLMPFVRKGHATTPDRTGQ